MQLHSPTLSWARFEIDIRLNKFSQPKKEEIKSESMADTERATDGDGVSTSETSNHKKDKLKKTNSIGTMKGVPVPEVLKFTSWWDEDKEESSLGNGSSAGGGLKRRYISLKFYTSNGTFDVSAKLKASMNQRE